MTQTLSIPSGRGSSALALPAPAQRARQPVPTPGLLLYGDLQKMGVSLHWHDFQTVGVVDWAQSLTTHGLVLCLNLEGQGTVCQSAGVLEFQPRTAGFFSPGGGLEGTRQAGQRHRFVKLEFSSRYLRRYLSACDGALHRLIEDFIAGDSQAAGSGEVRQLTHEQEAAGRRLLKPPVFQGGRGLWYQGQVLQIMAEFFFERRGEDELFCDRQKRLARERVERVIAILQRDLIAPPTLEAIGREVGCSPFHLSRTFSQAAGMTIPQYLRKLRMERAAELLRSGKHNVTEAALEVGYSSLSHFSQAFCRTMGCCPGLYPLKSNSTPINSNLPEAHCPPVG